MIDLSLIKKNQTIAVALSGGKDSMCLLHLLLGIKSEYNLTIKAINIDHSIRGKESEADSLFVKNYCEKLEVPLKFFKVDAIQFSKQNGYTLEQGARVLRYQIFDSLLNEKFCDVIATAHHQGDNVESILLNIFRGCGVDGLCGIENYSDKIIRPILSVSKEEILSYVKDNDIPFVTDETNFCDDYTRNYLRNSVIPRIKEVFPEVEKSILRLSNIAKETSDYLLAQAKKHLNVQSDDSVSISLPIEKPIFAKCVILALNSLGVKKDWEKKHIDIAFELTKNQTGKKINLPFGVIVFKEDENLVFQKETTTQNIVIPFSTNDFEFLGKNYKITSLPTVPKDLKDGFYLDLDKIPSGAVIRNKLDGDVFKVVNGKTKNLSDFLSEKKVPLRNREKIPLIAKESVVYAIFGLAVSEQTKIDDKTKNIIKIN